MFGGLTIGLRSPLQISFGLYVRFICSKDIILEQAYFLAQRVDVLQPVAVVCVISGNGLNCCSAYRACYGLWICVTVHVIALETDRQRHMKATL